MGADQTAGRGATRRIRQTNRLSAGARCSKAVWPSAPPGRRAWPGSPRRPAPRIERALALSSVSPAVPERHPSRRLPHAGEPVLRPLLRHAVGRAGFLRSQRRCATPSAGASRPVWNQYGYQPGVGVDPTGFLQPFHLHAGSPTEDGASTNDISTSGRPQHQSWNGGAMDAFVGAHLAADGVAELRHHDGLLRPATTCRSTTRWPTPSPSATPTTARCSGPTDPNRVMALSGTIDPAGTGGGPSSSRRRRAAAAVRHALRGRRCPSSCSMPA